MPSLNEKADAIVELLNEMGICSEAADAMRSAVRAYEIADLDLSSARKNKAAGGVTAGGGVAGGIVCGLIAETGVGILVCVIGGATGLLGGGLWYSASDDSEDAAELELDDAIDALDDALDAVCDCLEREL